MLRVKILLDTFTHWRVLGYCGVMLMLVFSAGCQDGDDDPLPQNIDKIVATVGSEGGTLELESGIRMIIPQGALTSAIDITLSQYKPQDYFSNPDDDRLVVGCTPDNLSFFKQVQLYFPVPEHLINEEIVGLAGLIDPESGAVEVYPSSKVTVDSKRYLLLETNHFSKYTGWFYETLPTSSPILEIPHYNQGESQYCWAADLQMVCEAIKHDDRLEIHDIVGYTGVNEDGYSQYSFRISQKVVDVVKERTGFVPDRKLWPRNSANAMDSYLRDRLSLGFPVMLFSPVQNHSFVVVGYDGNTFYINDSASNAVDGKLSYETKLWADFKVGEMDINAKFVTLSIPAPITSAGRLQTVNIGSGKLLGQGTHLQFKLPGTGQVVTKIGYNYDHTITQGYSFRDYQNNVKDTIPGNVEALLLNGIELANASRTQQKTFSVQTKVLNLSHPEKSYTSTYQSIPVNANSMGYYSEVIPVALFQNTDAVSEYEILVEAWDGSGTFDKFHVFFKLAPPEITAKLGIIVQVKTYSSDSIFSLGLNNGFPNDRNPVDVPNGAWQANSFIIHWDYSSDGITGSFDASFQFDASRSKILSMVWHFTVNGNDFLDVEGSDIPVSLVGNNYTAILSGQNVCSKLSEIDFHQPDVKEYLCTDKAWLHIEIPK